MRYVAPYFRAWEDVGLESPLGQLVAIVAADGCPGCLLVFDSMEALKKVYLT